MKRTEEALLALVRAGLWGKEDEAFSSGLFPLNEEEWQEVLEMARKQTVVGIACGGLNWLKENMLPPDDVMFVWVAEVDRIERTNKKMWEKTKEMFAIWQNAGLKPVLLKGQGVAMMYDNPWARTSGDVDVWFEDGVLPKGDELGEDVRCENKPDGSIEFRWKGLDVEIHRQAIDINSPWKQGKVREVLMRNKCTMHESIAVPGYEMNLLLQSAHVMKHAMGKGVGLRQLCDMARTCWSTKDNLNTAVLAKTYKEAGIEQWCRVLYGFMVKYLAFPSECNPYGEGAVSETDALMQRVMVGGNFGKDAVKNGKWQTLMAYVKNLRFSLSIAPSETLWTMWMLAKGQFAR